MWEVVIQPRDQGVAVCIADGSLTSVIKRVAYNRVWAATQGSSHPLHTFKSSLRRGIKLAQDEADKLNEPGKVSSG